jgi:hypothetical protein
MKMLSVSLRAAVVAAALSLAGTAALAQKAPPDPARMAAARDLMIVMGSDKQLDGMFQAVGQGMAQGAQGAGGGDAGAKAKQMFDSFIASFQKYRVQMLDDMAALYAERFTAEEMKVVADFYRSGPGAKFVAAMPELMQAGSQIGMAYTQKVMQDLGIKPPGR